MKIIAKLILTIIFIPVFLIFLFTINLRFQLLTPSFWEKTFNSEDTYSKLSLAISKNLESRTVAEGGKASDIKILTDLVTPEYLKDTISKNISSILQYANGKANEKITEQINLTELLKEFNVTGISESQIQMVSRVGIGSWLFLVIMCLLSFLVLYLLYLLTNSGKRLVAPGVALVISGVIALLVTGAGTIIRINWTKDLINTSNLGNSLIGIIAPPIILRILTVWLSCAAVAIILGVVLFFIKKPYNKIK